MAKEAFETDLKNIKERTEDIEVMNEAIDSAVREMDEEITKVFLSGDTQEAWSRRNILLVRGILVKRGQDTSQIILDLFQAMGVRCPLQNLSLAQK